MEPAKLQENMNPDQDLFSEAKICRELYRCLDLRSDFHDLKEQSKEEDTHDETEEEEEEDEEFSFMAFGDNGSPVAAEDAFVDGQIKPVFPLFNRDLLLSVNDLPVKVPVDKVFVEMPERDHDRMTSSSSGNDEISGPYCDLTSRKAVEVVGQVAQGEGCKKSNSTGFSKIWRFKELMGRSNSDGRDAFVFLNNVNEKKVEGKEKVVNVSGKVKKVGRTGKTTTSLSAHEVYLKSKAKEEERRRQSYLPYRQVGFFTNVNGGLSKNVHPY